MSVLPAGSLREPLRVALALFIALCLAPAARPAPGVEPSLAARPALAPEPAPAAHPEAQPAPAAPPAVGAAGRTLWVGPRPAWMATEVGLEDGPTMPSLAQALAAARDGDTIVVPGGDHGGELVVSSSVRILGYGKGELPRLHKRLVIRADDVLIDRLALAPAAPSAVLVEDAARVTIRRCELRRASEGLHLVRAVDARIEDNLFERVNRAVFIDGGAGHRLRGNLIHHAAMYALEVSRARDVRLDDNRVLRPDWAGIIVHSGGQLQARGNVITGGDVGFSIQTDGNLLEGNLVQGAGRAILVGVSPRGVDPAERHATAFLDSDGEDGGARVRPAGNRLIDNRLQDCRREGILLRSARDTAVLGNRIQGGLHGVVLMSDARGNQLGRNTVSDVSRAAVAVLDSSGNEIADAPSVRLVSAPGNTLLRCADVSQGGPGFDLPRPPAAPLGDGRLLLFGDLHTHSLLSDGCTTTAEILSYARDVLGLPFCALSDHGEVLSRQAGRWPALNATCRDYALPGRFVAIPGYEVTYPVFWDGHYNVYFPNDRGVVHRAPYDDYTGLCPMETYSPARLLDALRADDNEALVVRHHFGPTPDYWLDAPDDRQLVPLTEITSVHGVFAGDHDVDANGNDRRNEETAHNGTVRQGLEAGRVFGIVASSDSHYGFPGDRGLLAVLSDGVDTASVFEALRARRTYGTTGAPIALGFTVNGAPMGSVLELAPAAQVEAVVTGTAALRSFELLRDGEVVARGELIGERGRLTYTDGVAPSPGRRYRVRAVQVDGQVAWSSPVWFEPPPPLMGDAERALDRERMGLLVYAATLRAWHKLHLGKLEGRSPSEALADPAWRDEALTLWDGWVRSARAVNAMGEELGLTSRNLSGRIVDRWQARWGGQLPMTVRQVNPILNLDEMAALLGVELR